ncbi:MAG: transketolase C-terminal domain-containing protein [Patescibacteria group bacterium]
MSDRKLITGNEAVVFGAIEGGAEAFFGYPITPATEILEGWAKLSDKNSNLKFLQAEDEIASGFAAIGAILAGTKAFTATAGIGHVLMQDAISMAENQRLPFVAVVAQRGGPSTGTVNYSQQELNLASFGGNGDGLRIVYSASSVEELYYLSAKIFSTAWKYRFPTILLSDGYLAKQKVTVKLSKPVKPFPESKILKEDIGNPTYIRNCYGSEEEFAKILRKNIDDYKNIISKVSECESYKTAGVTDLIIAHGSPAASAKDAVDELRENKISAGLVRPITVRPLDCRTIASAAKIAKRIYIIESSFEQFSRTVIYKIPEIAGKVNLLLKPAEGISAEEIVNFVTKVKK